MEAVERTENTGGLEIIINLINKDFKSFNF